MPARAMKGWIDWSALPRRIAPLVANRSTIRGPGIEIAITDPEAHVAADEQIVVVSLGKPRFVDGRFAEIARTRGVAEAWRLALRHYGEDAGTAARGPFALVALDAGARRRDARDGSILDPPAVLCGGRATHRVLRSRRLGAAQHDTRPRPSGAIRLSLLPHDPRAAHGIRGDPTPACRPCARG